MTVGHFQTGAFQAQPMPVSTGESSEHHGIIIGSFGERTMAGEPILIVDDDPTNLKLVSFLLAKRGFQVRSAAGAQEALEVLETFHPALILMDMQMPGIDGFELTRRLKADPGKRDITIIALTAYAMKGDEERVREAGCDGYLPKPIHARTLLQAVASWISGKK
jgi:two-component system cell cycle response regulator DivK